MANDNGAITNIKITATADTRSAQTSIANLARKLELLKTAVGNGIKLPNEEKIEAFATAMGGLKGVRWTSIANGINKVADALERIASISINSNTARAISKIVSAGTTTAKANKASTAVASAQAQQAGTSVSVGKAVSGSGEVAVAEAKVNEEVRDSISLWKKLGFSADEAYNSTAKLADAIGNGLRNGAYKAAVALGSMIRNLAVAPWKKLAKSIGDAVSRLSGFFMALKRIAVYRAIRWALKELMQAFREGIANLYQYSLLINGTFAKSMDMLATSAMYAKNSLAAMVAPIVDAVAPAVDYLTDCFVNCLNVVNELFAALTGADTWTKAIKYPIEYAEAADDATGSAKKLRATLLGFDEINRLDDNSKGSRGKAADQLDYSKMFEQKTVTNKAKGFIESLKKAFKSSDFTDMGRTLGEKLKNGLDKIPWEDIKQSVNSHATMVGTLLNGLVDVPNLGTSIGRSIAEAFNVAVGKLNTFLTVVDWKKVGKFLADGVNGFLKNFEIEGLGKNLALIINSGVSLLHNFVNNVEWKKFGEFLAKGINSFFDETNLKELGHTISDAIIGALAFVHEFFDETDFENIGKKIAEFFEGVDWTNILEGLAGAIFKGIKAAFETLKGMFEENFVVGSIAAIAIANCIAGAFGLPKVTSIIASGLSALVSGGAAGATATAATAATTATAAGGGGIMSSLLSGLGSIALPVTLAAVAIGAAWTLAKYMHNNDQNLNTKEPYAGAIFDMENDIETYQKRMYNLGKGRDLDAPLTTAELSAALSTRVNSKISGFDTNGGIGTSRSTDITIESIANGMGNELSKLGISDTFISGLKTNVANTASYTKDIKDNTGKTYAALVPSGTSGGAAKALTNKITTGVNTYASGGMPDTGSLFLAGESGAELIYSSSAGTNVANRDQIAESVAIGNEESNELLREQNGLLRSLLAKDTNVITTITTGQITSALNRANVRSGSTVVPVQGG